MRTLQDRLRSCVSEWDILTPSSVPQKQKNPQISELIFRDGSFRGTTRIA